MLDGLIIERRSPFPLIGLLARLVVVLIAVPACASSIYGWQVRTNSTEVPPSFYPGDLEQQAVALFPAITMPGLRGNEVGLGRYLGEVLHKVVPSWKIVSEQEVSTRINRQGLAARMTVMRSDYEQSNILDHEALRKIAVAVGVRYAFQLRLAAFTQTMTDRWKIPAFDVRVTQTRSSIMRLALQLWDAETGELVWTSVAETNMANEAVSQDPVYLEDIARATLGSMLSDLLNGKTASQYTPVNKLLDNLIREAMPKEKDSKAEAAEGTKK